ncbi:hypothetical protein [Elizabethkingia sp. YR214]|uniref:hypothetical protein n=1 Tax=Elizabethkingia sp. YR214 TaxID=2135667 RepID=UPI000D3019BE|nr:hypothetical protein [Elizabethkingia sp. YR214]
MKKENAIQNKIIYKYENKGISEYIILKNDSIGYPNFGINEFKIIGDSLKVVSNNEVKVYSKILSNTEAYKKSTFDSLVISYNNNSPEGNGVHDFDIKVNKNGNAVYYDANKEKTYKINLDNTLINWINQSVKNEDRSPNKISLSKNEVPLVSYAIIVYKNKKKYFIYGEDINRDSNIKLLLTIVYYSLFQKEKALINKKEIFESLELLNNYAKKSKNGVTRIPPPPIKK